MDVKDNQKHAVDNEMEIQAMYEENGTMSRENERDVEQMINPTKKPSKQQRRKVYSTYFYKKRKT